MTYEPASLENVPVLSAPQAHRTLTETIQRLATIDGRDDRVVVSCYLSLEPGERTGRAYLSRVKSRIHELEPTLEILFGRHHVREAYHRDLDRLVQYLSRSRMPATRGLAVFLCEPLNLFELVPLPRAVRFRLIVDRTPYLRDLAALETAFGRVLTAVVDRTRARIFEVTAFGAQELVDLVADNTRGGRFHSDRGGSPGWGERGFHQRIRNEKKRHFAAVSEELVRLDEARPARGLVLAAAGPTVKALERHLAPTFESRLMGVTHLIPRIATPATVHAATITVAGEHDASAQAALAASVQEEVGAGRAVVGLRDTMRALFEGRAREILIRTDAEAHGFRCAQTGRLVLERGDCRVEGQPEPVPYLIDELLEEALRRRVPVIALHLHADGQLIDGVAARLRFTSAETR